jgi:molybdopterin-containing oxidoreductase family iron-sulfur binding subunit
MSLRSMLNPDVATRPKGVVEKCTFCHHRIRATEERARIDEKKLTDADFRELPACAQACPARAITFGDLNDPDSEVSRLHKSPRATRLLEELGTKPKVVYLRDTKWTE